ncbi:MAG: hypothetical protein COS41_04275 [Elusimicrobia bacterium CG03_land_8_20_14_0_80_50_18]|nr:MAG: hypothetical protein COS41_04275 [Elusimicrobia bacterium CG03_land_8_20_14_0_80_50_18]PIX16553.1 MAG: hypothetical protein COZ72_00605 [Elusimicrobia bacterium CG_4_8_14_3_um_filter_50_9]
MPKKGDEYFMRILNKPRVYRQWICFAGEFSENMRRKIARGMMCSKKKSVAMNSICKIKKSAPYGPVMPKLIASQRGAFRTTRNGLTALTIMVECWRPDVK